MRFLLGLVLCCGAVLPCLGQATGDAPGLLKEPREVFAAAAPFYDFSDPTLKPWHLKARYQLYDEKGKKAEQGTFEYWWASPKVRRSSWTRPSATRTDWFAADGGQNRKESGTPLRYFERNLGSYLLSQLPGRAVLDSGRMKLELKMVKVGQANLACVSTALQWEVDGKLQAPASAVPQNYCFDPSTLALRIAYSQSITTEFSQIVKTQGHYLAKDVAVFVGKQEVFSISVETIDAMDSSNAALNPVADAVLSRSASDQSIPEQTADDMTIGSLVKKTQPVYPMVAKAAREQGVVVIGAVIGTDGRVHDLEVLSAPSKLLADSAVDAVKQWQYRPYLLNGVAVEVETVVDVTYSLGG